MSYNTETFVREISEYNNDLGQACQRWGFHLKVYKIIKAITQLSAVGAGIYAMSLGADPLPTFGLVALIWAGPEAFEMALVRENGK